MEIQKRIIEVATEMFFRVGIRSVTMDDIARELGISKKTIYQHFADKDTLVFEVTKNALEQEKCEQERIHKMAKNPIDEIILATQQMREMFQHIQSSLFFDLQKYHTKAWLLYAEHKKSFFELVLRNLREGQEQGLYRMKMNIEVLARLRIESVEMAFNNDFFSPRKYNLLDIQLEFIDHFLRGTLTQKGLELYETYNTITP